MQLFDLFTARGFATALKSHHENLHKNHSFSPLSGAKPLHRFAEIFGLKGAEQLEAKLTQLEVANVKAANINLCFGTLSRQLAVYSEPDFSSDENHTVRVQLPGDNDFLITSVDFDVMKEQPFVFYAAPNKAIVTFGYVQVVVTLKNSGITAELFEHTLKERLDSDGDDLTSPQVSCIDSQSVEVTFEALFQRKSDKFTDHCDELERFERYHDNFYQLVKLIDANAEISHAVSENYFDQGIGYQEAANDYLSELHDTISFQFARVISNNYYRVNVISQKNTYRFLVPHQISIGDKLKCMKNNLADESIVWKGDLYSTIIAD